MAQTLTVSLHENQPKIKACFTKSFPFFQKSFAAETSGMFKMGRLLQSCMHGSRGKNPKKQGAAPQVQQMCWILGTLTQLMSSNHIVSDGVIMLFQSIHTFNYFSIARKLSLLWSERLQGAAKD